MDLSKTTDVRRFMGRMERAEGECEKHGKFSTLRIIGSSAACPKCFDESQREKDREEAFSRRVAHLSEVSGIPQRYAACGFKGYRAVRPDQRALVEKAKGFMRMVKAEQEQWAAMVLTGGPGTGKTHIACAVANNLISHGISCRYTTAQEMIDEVRRAYDEDGMSEASQKRIFTSAFSLLIVDEIDVIRTGSDADLTLVSGVINTRYAEQRPVIAVSNQDYNSLSRILGKRITSRLYENGEVVACDWEDFRVNGMRMDA